MEWILREQIISKDKSIQKIKLHIGIAFSKKNYKLFTPKTIYLNIKNTQFILQYSNIWMWNVVQ